MLAAAGCVAVSAMLRSAFSVDLSFDMVLKSSAGTGVGAVECSIETEDLRE